MHKPAWQFLALALLSAACSITFGDMKEPASSEGLVSFQLSSNIRVLKLDTFNGVFEVVERAPDANDNLVVSGESKIWASANTKLEAEARVAEMEWVYSERGDVGTITITRPSGRSGSPGGSLRSLSIPAGLALELDSSNGNLEITGNFHDFKLDTSNGRITAQLDDGWSGRGVAVTANGRIAIRCEGKLDCRLDMKTGNGNPKVLGPPLNKDTGTGSLRLRTSNGHIVVTHLFDSE